MPAWDPQRGSWPLPEHRRRRLRPLLIAGVVAVIAGRLLDVDLLWGMGVGIVVAGSSVLFLDHRARRQLP